MKAAKRASTLVVALALAFAMILAGCQNTAAPIASAPSASSAASATTAASAAPAATATSTALDPVSLKWYFGGTWPQTDQQMVFDAVNKLLQQQLNTTVNFVPIGWGDYDSKMSVVIASGQEYDVCFTANWINNYVNNVAKGAFVPLNDMLPKDAPKTFAAVPTSFWDAAKINGSIYGVINQQISARVATICIPQDDATKFGLDPNSYTPGDISSLTDYLKKVHDAEPQEYPAVDMGDVGEYLGQDWFDGTVPGAIDVSDPNMTVIDQWESPAMLKLVQTLREWNQAGLMNVSKEVTNTFNTMTDRTGHLQSLLMGGCYKPGDAQLESGISGYPYAEFASNKSILTTGGIIATMQAISRTSKNPDRALMMLELFNNDQDDFMTLNYGIKGTHWDVNASGFMVAGPSQSKYNPQVPWELATNYMAVVVDGQPADVWAQTKQVNDSALKSPAIGFSFDPTPVKDDIAKCQAVMTQYQRGLELGMYSDAQYSEFISKLKTAGSDAIIKEIQNQVDKWKASKAS